MSASGRRLLVGRLIDAGYRLVPDKRVCYFHQNIGATVVREVVDAAIKLTEMTIYRLVVET